MNKYAITFVGLAGFAFSMAASAGQIASNANGVSNAPVTSATDCSLLQEDIKINLSKNVAAGYACDSTVNTIGVGACTLNGVKDPNGNNNIYVGSSAGGSVRPWTTTLAPCDTTGAAAQADSTAIAALGTGS